MSDKPNAHTRGDKSQVYVSGSKSRHSMTLTESYLGCLARLIEEGVYISQQEAMRGALRLLFQYHKMEPFYPKRVEVEPKQIEEIE